MSGERTKDFITHQTTNLHHRIFGIDCYLSQPFLLPLFLLSIHEQAKCLVVNERERCTLNTVGR